MILFIILNILEIAGYLGYLLITKNSVLEKTIENQQNYIDALRVTISNIDIQLKELDTSGMFKSDDEIGFFFENIKILQENLAQFK